MATARVNMKGYYKQQKKGGTSGISKSKAGGGGATKKTPPSHSATLGSNIAQTPALVTRHGALDLQEDYDEDEEVLRQFDLNMAYGPCIGVARLDRWTRAYKLGLNPPKEVETLLKSGKVQTGSLWDGRV